MKGAGVCVRERERSHALKGLVVWLCLLEWNVSGLGSAKFRWSPSGTIRTARVRIEHAAVVIARARQYRTPRQGFPPRAIVPYRENRTTNSGQFLLLRAK